MGFTTEKHTEASPQNTNSHTRTHMFADYGYSNPFFMDHGYEYARAQELQRARQIQAMENEKRRRTQARQRAAEQQAYMERLEAVQRENERQQLLMQEAARKSRAEHTTAALCVQRGFRKYLNRRLAAEQEAAARLQAHVRGFLTRHARRKAEQHLGKLQSRLDELDARCGPNTFGGSTADVQKQSLVFCDSVMALLLEADGITNSSLRTRRRALVKQMNRSIDMAESKAKQLVEQLVQATIRDETSQEAESTTEEVKAPGEAQVTDATDGLLNGQSLVIDSIGEVEDTSDDCQSVDTTESVESGADTEKNAELQNELATHKLQRQVRTLQIQLATEKAKSKSLKRQLWQKEAILKVTSFGLND